MTFAEYQEKANNSVKYCNRGSNLKFLIFGLVGECGEITNYIKNYDDCASLFTENLSQEIKEHIKSDAGDLLWYLSQIAFELGCTLEEVAEKNIKKKVDIVN